tara:strand:- start:586 stop:1488 length:903 start_codon:yes stop_codon:yes gene_type:complete
MNLENFENILITGGRGNSAYFFLKKLEQKKFKKIISVLCRDKKKNKYFEQFDLNFKIFNGDINDEKFLNSCFNNIDTILHTANMENSKIIVDSAAKKVKWIILANSAMIYSKHLTPFIKNRIKLDKEISKNNSNITILRPTMVYGSLRDINMSKLIKYLDRFKIFPIFGDGKNLIQPIFIEDLSNAYFKVIENKKITFNKSYDLGGKKPIKYIDALKFIEKKLNKKKIYLKIPIPLGIFLLKILKILSFGKIIVNASQIKRQDEDKIVNYDTAQKDFGFSPISFEDGISKQINEYNLGKN